MEDRRYGTARASSSFREEGSYKEQRAKPHRKESNRTRINGNTSGESKFASGNKRSRPNSDSRYQAKKHFSPKRKNKKPWKRDVSIPIVSELQITDGKHRGKYLESSDSPKAGVTNLKLREAFFKILHRQVRAGRVLDLCSGIGTIGIEAISRGAIVSTFVERSARFSRLINRNLEKLEIKTGHGEVYETEALPFLKKVAKRGRVWDVVYYGPPFDADYESVLNLLKKGVALKNRGVLVIEHHAEMFFPEKLGVLNRWKVVTEDEVSLSFYDSK